MQVKNFTDIKSFFFDNKTVKQTIFKNTFWLSIGMSVERLLGFILLVYVARILGAAEYGKFSFALAFVSLFVIFQDFGLPTLVTREYARNEGEKDKEEFYSVISLKILLSIATFIIILASSFFITADPQIRQVIMILAIFSLLNGFSTLFYSFFQARQKMEYQTWLETLQYLLISGLGLFVLFSFPSVENLSYSYLAAGLISLIMVLIFFNVKIFTLKILWQSSVWRKFLMMSWPLALTGLFAVLYNYTDSVMMGYWGMVTETGWYNAAYRIILVVLIPGGLISGSFYPVLSKFFKDSKEKLQQVWNSQVELMILFALPLVTGGIVLAPRIIDYFYSASFFPSILAFQILIVMAGLLCLYRPFSDVLIAANQQRKTFWITLFGALFNIILNLILIPKYSLYGAAATTVVTYIIIFLISVGLAIKYTPIKLPYLKIFSVFIMAILSSTLMYFVITRPLIYNLNVFLSAIIGALTYLSCLLVLKRITKPIYEKA